MNSATSLIFMFMAQANNKGNKPFLWSKKNGVYEATTWQYAAKIVTNIASKLLDLGIKKGDRIVLCSENRTEWVLSNLAIMASGAIPVPAYTTNTVNDHYHILQDSGAKSAIFSNDKILKNLLPAAEREKGVKFLLSIDDPQETINSEIKIHSWKQLSKSDNNENSAVTEIISKLTKKDIAIIIYTSGTGGVPKGVMLPHRAIIHNCQGAFNAIEELGLDDEVFLSFLPLSHSYEYTAGLWFPIFIGAQIYFAEGLDQLSRNMGEARPTIMTAVPRLYELMHAKITKSIKSSGGLKEIMFLKTVELGIKKYHKVETLSVLEVFLDYLLDKIIRNKVRKNFGGRLKVLVSGGAPLNTDIGIFFTALGLNLLQGYGQTESAPVISVNRPGHVKMETVGTPLINTDVKIADDGEILVRGDLIMSGYWNNDEATKNTIKDGWLHTGDIGTIDQHNFIEITDRKKDIIVNSGGDNISPQRVEGFLTLEPEIAQAMVYGDKKSHIVALIIPDIDFLNEWKQKTGNEANGEILEEDKFHQEISAAVDRVNKNLSVIERVRRFHISSEGFTVENEMITPTLKVRRHKIIEKYQDDLENLYSNKS
ncbi:MAG: AMP-dependent synthetase/ligase [Rhodospirillales bacterium]|tara:strand:+ start:286 stop:2073 length:1788 start_codon:yes stop_codon:yes gene_type:complete